MQTNEEITAPRRREHLEFARNQQSNPQTRSNER